MTGLRDKKSGKRCSFSGYCYMYTDGKVGQLDAVSCFIFVEEIILRGTSRQFMY